jgi:phosphatidate cytidylyltransferase
MFSGLTPILAMRLVIFIEAMVLVGAAGMAATLRRADREKRRKGWTKFVSYFLIVHTVFACAGAPGPWFPGLVILIIIVGMAEIARLQCKRRKAGWKWRMIVIPWAVFGLLAAGTFLFAVRQPMSRIIFTYGVVAVLDAFSQLSGQLVGRRPLAPRISPSKTVEGAIGGTFCALAASLVLWPLAGHSPWFAAGCGMIIALCGIGGDLLSSWYKRLAGVKDYSGWLPGQGGVIDRFNSLICAAPVMLFVFR